MLNDHCHRVSTQLQSINIIIIVHLVILFPGGGGGSGGAGGKGEEVSAFTFVYSCSI
jgi:hypothetical protein